MWLTAYGVRLSACKYNIRMVKGELKSKKEHKRGIFEHELNKNLGLELCTYSLTASQAHLLISKKTHPSKG